MKFTILLLSVILNIGTVLTAQESLSQSDIWIDNWIEGITYSKESKNYPKAIEAYSKTIRDLKQNNEFLKIELEIERGNLYFKGFDFDKAIKDFSSVIENNQATKSQRVAALWGRSMSYLASGKIQEFTKDADFREGLQPFITTIQETKKYSVVKFDPYFLHDTVRQKRLVGVLLMLKKINSQNDVIFAENGLAIIKKTQ